MKNIYLDIETIPCQSADYREKVRQNLKPPGNIKKPESIAQWMAENADTAADEAVAKTSFDPAHGHIVCIGYALEDGEPLCAMASTVDQEAAVLEVFFESFPPLGMLQFIGHNAAAFDLRFILCRAIVLGVKIPKIFPRDIKPWSETVFDTMIAWAGTRGTIGQDRLAEALGLPLKGDFDGSMVAQAWANGEHDKIAEYCRRDVETVRSIHHRFLAVGF